MKKIFKALKFSSIFLFAMALFIACDKDFNTIDSGVLGKNNAHFNTDDSNLQILAYNKKLDSLQINGLLSNLFGVFNDPAYGLTTASIVTQVAPTSFKPNFGENPEIESVVLSIPYFSKVTGTDGETTLYALDSLYGNPTAKMKLSIYQNNYFLKDFNPEPNIDEQNYFSNASSGFNSTIDGTNVVNFDDQKGDLIYHKDDFVPSAEEITITTGTGENESTTRSVPALRVLLDKGFWKEMIIDKQDDLVLSNANHFKDYFRGLYMKVEAIDDDGSMVLLNLASTSANITINYTKGATDSRVESTYVLNFTGNKLNTFVNDFTIPLTNGDKTLGDKKLYLKGTEGSMAVIDLFGGDMMECEDENGVITMRTPLDCFKKTYRQLDENGNYLPQVNGNYPLKKLINEAHLVIYEDETMPVPPKVNPTDKDYHYADRIYAYDIKNNIPTIDYSFDGDTSDPFNSKVISLGQRKVIKDNNGVSVAKYKIRLTEHLNAILLKNSTNTKIGLVLSTNVSVDYNPSTGFLKTASILNSNDEVTEIPSTTLLTPRGTILYGNHESVPDNRKMKLEIFFTEPNL